MEQFKNTSYIFIPFKYEKRKDFHRVIDSLERSRQWELIHDEIMYMLKYVSDKMDSRQRDRCQCFHFRFVDSEREAMGLQDKTQRYFTAVHEFWGDRENRFAFRLLDVQLYCFSTGVCVCALHISFEGSNPFWIASAQYYLKKVSREPIYAEGGSENAVTLLGLAERLMKELNAVSALEFFYYANENTERANIFTYVEMEKKESFAKELYYLRKCYHEGFLYTEDEELYKKETFSSSREITWGLSPEAAVCLTCPGKEQGTFIRDVFYSNFNTQYLFMYVLLLHQKYVLYMFLTQIGIGTYDKLDMLEEYRNDLYEFETDFVYSCVTEVTQYQNLYDRMQQAFSLKKMYEDVQEPLISLAEVRRETLEKQAKKREEQAKKRDKNINEALILLSILSFFSALVDSFDFAEAFGKWFLTEEYIRVAQGFCILVILGILIYVVISLIRSRKD